MAITKYGTGERTHIGRVVETFEKNYSDDSDFYAIVLNDSLDGWDIIEYDTTRCGGLGSADVDCSKADFDTFWANRGRAKYLAWCADQDHRANLKITKGAYVRVVKGKKAPVGVEGRVFYTKECVFGIGWNSKRCQKIGLEDMDGNTYWTYDHNVERTDLEFIEGQQAREASERADEFDTTAKVRAFVTSVRCVGNLFF